MKAAPARRSFARLPRERRVTDILAAARQLFTAHGYENTSMSVIAERAGVVEGTVYKYFDTKRDLLIQVLVSWYQSMLDDYAEDLARIAGLRNRLRYVIWRHLKSIETEPALCRLFFRDIRISDDYSNSPLHAMNRFYTEFAVGILREGVETRELRADLSLAMTRDLIYGTIEHLTWRYITIGGDLQVERLADQLADFVLAGARRTSPADELNGVVERLDGLAARFEAGLGRPS